MPELKNETFIKNIVDPKTGKQENLSNKSI